jgi:hypothetical protein
VLRCHIEYLFHTKVGLLHKGNKRQIALYDAFSLLKHDSSYPHSAYELYISQREGAPREIATPPLSEEAPGSESRHTKKINFIATISSWSSDLIQGIRVSKYHGCIESSSTHYLNRITYITRIASDRKSAAMFIPNGWDCYCRQCSSYCIRFGDF